MSGPEIVGAIFRITILATHSLQISKALYEVRDTLANALNDITDLVQDLEIFSDELNLLARLLKVARTKRTKTMTKMNMESWFQITRAQVDVSEIFSAWYAEQSLNPAFKWFWKARESYRLFG